MIIIRLGDSLYNLEYIRKYKFLENFKIEIEFNNGESVTIRATRFQVRKLKNLIDDK